MALISSTDACGRPPAPARYLRTPSATLRVAYGSSAALLASASGPPL